MDPTAVEQVVVLIDRPVGIARLPLSGDNVVPHIERFPGAPAVTDEPLTLGTDESNAVVVEPRRANGAEWG